MRRFLVAAAMLLSVLGASAGAGPATLPAPGAGESLIVQTRGCHADERRHYVPEYGRPVWHYHNRRCRPIRAGGGPVVRDCHRDVRLHRINGVRVWHRHVGPDCAVRVVQRSN
ncbi:hypothetical protein RB623_21905 [Mesorhizobium sp. LHD-90]|uniref:hypothetical protein n=1 Tax=Mesorhizobium sp. LHD-90 TaxID=3071414 RepID=UPI0027DF2A7D|nr:hypothetical protein [Mesorhizobium sp. LHD-90]MDQ6436714.1 hypothetical protein [Mesorhizobium sp. LHD-90]